MKITIHNVNVPNLFKRKSNTCIDEAKISFGNGVENYLADMEFIFDSDNFTIQNVFVNKTESLRICYNGKTLVIDREDFTDITIE